jgi:hypothetical protein
LPSLDFSRQRSLLNVRPRDAVILAGIVSLLVIWWVWGALAPLPVVADEHSYVLQARIFATGRWTAAPPPIREFFEQSMVLTAPRVASKYPPGHALLLTIGALLGNVAIIPLLLTAATGALLFMLARRAANTPVAVLTLVIWLGDPINLRFRPSYFSELTTQLMLFVSWWSLLEWRATRQRRWLLALAAAMGWGAITRPMTMLAFLLPFGYVVIRDVARGRHWRDFALAAALGVTILGIIPLWNARTTGDWKLLPLTIYHREYLPFEKPGFGVDRTLPTRKLNPVNAITYAEFYWEHERHTLRNLPGIAAHRLKVIGIAQWTKVRGVLVPFVIIGLTMMTADIAFAFVCSALVFVVYLSYAHYAEWMLYYFEAMPILSFLTAMGVWRVIEALSRWRPGASPRLRGALFAAAMGLLLALTTHELLMWRELRRQRSAWYRNFEAQLATLPKVPMVIFVRYAPRLQPHPHIVRNSPTLADDPVWIVNDLGARNQELMRIAGERIPLVFDEESLRFERLASPAIPASPAR